MSKAEKREEALRKAKEKKQKKILIGLSPLLLLMLAWQGPGVLSSFTSEPPPPPVVQPEAPGEAPPTTPGSDPTTAPPPTTAGGGAAETPATPVSATLSDTDGVSMADSGQLVTFDRFLGKDPFRQLVKDKEETGGGADVPPGDSTPPPANGGNGNGDGGGNPSPPAVYTTATITVNGQRETLAVKQTFPKSDPIFRLAGVSKTGIKIGLVTGEFTGGDGTITVKVGKAVTLVSQPDGLRFVIHVVAVGS